MSVNNTFEAYKIAREIRRSGVSNTFYRNSRNEFGEPNPDAVLTIGALKSLYHEQSGYIQVSTSEGVQYRTKKMPMLMAPTEDVKMLGLEAGDYTIIDGRRYTVNGIINLYNWGIISDISLEIFDNGQQRTIQ